MTTTAGVGHPRGCMPSRYRTLSRLAWLAAAATAVQQPEAFDTTSNVLGLPDVVHRQTLTRLAFGSCNKQYKPQPLWPVIASLQPVPQAWVWMGDAVYTPHARGRDASARALADAYSNQSARADYRSFLAALGGGDAAAAVVHGTWDDHDYGVNDAGKENPLRDAAQDAFLSFLGVPSRRSDADAPTPTPTPAPAPRGDARGAVEPRPNGTATAVDGTATATAAVGGAARRSRRGVYSSVLWSGEDDGGDRAGGAGRGVRLLLLDTRSHRDAHFVPSVGGSHVPLMPLVAAASRAAVAALGLGRDFGGDVLGDAQWRWLDAQVEVQSNEAMFKPCVFVRVRSLAFRTKRIRSLLSLREKSYNR